METTTMTHTVLAFFKEQLLPELKVLSSNQVKLADRLDAMQIEMRSRFDLVDKRFEQIDKRFEQIDAQIKAQAELAASQREYVDTQIKAHVSLVDKRLEQIDVQIKAQAELTHTRIDEINRRIDQIDRRIDQIDKRIEVLDRKLEVLDATVRKIRDEDMVKHERDMESFRVASIAAIGKLELMFRTPRGRRSSKRQAAAPKGRLRLPA